MIDVSASHQIMNSDWFLRNFSQFRTCIFSPLILGLFPWWISIFIIFSWDGNWTTNNNVGWRLRCDGPLLNWVKHLKTVLRPRLAASHWRNNAWTTGLQDMNEDQISGCFISTGAGLLFVQLPSSFCSVLLSFYPPFCQIHTATFVAWIHVNMTSTSFPVAPKHLFIRIVFL